MPNLHVLISYAVLDIKHVSLSERAKKQSLNYRSYQRPYSVDTVALLYSPSCGDSAARFHKWIISSSTIAKSLVIRSCHRTALLLRGGQIEQNSVL